MIMIGKKHMGRAEKLQEWTAARRDVHRCESTHATRQQLLHQPSCTIQENKINKAKKLCACASIRNIEENGWNQTKTAKVLGIQRTYVVRLINELNIRVNKV
jgi:transcriptional regulator with GAF, ATPase, and Fis domain